MLNWLKARRAMTVIMLVFLIGLLYYSQNTFIIIDIQSIDKNTSDIDLTKLNDSGTRTDVFTIGDLALIPRDTERIEVKNNKNWESTVYVSNLPWIGIKTVSTTIQPDKNANKVLGDSHGCVVSDKNSEILASYRCYDPNGLYIYKTSSEDGVSWTNEAFLSFPRAYDVTNYKNGLLGISNSASSQLFYADMDTKSVSLPKVPYGIKSDDLKSISIHTDTVNNTGNFLLVDGLNSKIHLATENNNDVTYQEFSFDEDLLENNSLQCILRKTTAYCYIGWPSADPHPSSDDKEEDFTKRPEGVLYIVNFSANKASYKSYKISKKHPIDNFYIDDNNQLYSKSNDNLYSLEISGDTINRTIITPAAGDISAGKHLYFIANNKVYEFDSHTKQSRLIFTSKHLRLSTINHTNSKLYINAYIDGEPGNRIHTYEINNEPNKTPGERLIDKLPVYPDENQSAIINMDINGDKIHIVLPDYVTFNEFDQIISDDKTFALSRQEAINYLSTLIPDLNKYKITFSRASK